MTDKSKSLRVLLVSANREEINMSVWPLGIACVAGAARRAGHDVKLLDLMREPDPHAVLLKSVREFIPEVIGVSVRNIDNQQMRNNVFYLDAVRDLIGLIKNISGAPVVLGGSGYSIFPESALSYLGADFGIPGEGESAFTMLLERIGKGMDPEGPYVLHRAGYPPSGKRSYIHNPDDYPLPEISTSGMSAYRDKDFWMPVQTRRGCSLDCSYCSTPLIEGRMMRKRSPHAVVSWLRTCAASDIRRFHFVDNTFNLPYDYAYELCAAIAEADLGITWRCILYPWKTDEKLVAMMERAGCVELSLGTESGSVDILNSMNKRFTIEDVKRASELTGRHGIERMGFLMLGGPGETLETAEESLRFIDSLKLEYVKITIGVRIYPHTAVARAAVLDGLISPDDDLLLPKFYIAPGNEAQLYSLADEWIRARKNWIM